MDVGNPEVGIPPTSRNSTASSGDAILGCVIPVSRRTTPTPTVEKHHFTGEELQVKFLPDSREISLKYERPSSGINARVFCTDALENALAFLAVKAAQWIRTQDVHFVFFG
jgi:hypothetical protein